MTTQQFSPEHGPEAAATSPEQHELEERLRRSLVAEIEPALQEQDWVEEPRPSFIAVYRGGRVGAITPEVGLPEDFGYEIPLHAAPLTDGSTRLLDTLIGTYVEQLKLKYPDYRFPGSGRVEFEILHYGDGVSVLNPHKYYLFADAISPRQDRIPLSRTIWTAPEDLAG